MPAAMQEDLSPEVMLAFYRRLYPFKSLFTWLNHEHTPTKQFINREFAFTLAGDVYLRYQSFVTADEMKKQVCQMNPTRFEIGPVYSARPRDRKTVRPTAFQPQLRELVFDIDMTDYDSIRTCCQDAAICARCWKFIAVAVRVLDSSIRDQFGYKHLLWVYSGRRGIHLWISDAEAMELTDEQRRALVGWMTVIQGGKDMVKKVNVRRGAAGPLPPSLQAVVDSYLKFAFPDIILDDQNLFSVRERWEEMLKLLPPGKVRNELQEEWDMDSERASADKWQDMRDAIKSADSKEKSTLKLVVQDIVLQYTYPRLDAEVSKHRNHLLKAPFCVHPKTGRVCVPVDPSDIDNFNPEAVPTVGQLLQELNNVVTETEGEHHSDWEKTSLKPYVDMMDKHAQALMEEVRKTKRGADLSW
ncbi:prim-pol domain-containing protein [Irpex rosettiformis]|uniref:Prim-pol domain-containing protein n=1 Tax=Irpex rosettiformis TaxID=378272 RepID=A0ACB8U860_9APHY|nr:prim-pol domain-containing protein [Irpex rosettiformis]